jgi:hypothetical protein
MRRSLLLGLTLVTFPVGAPSAEDFTFDVPYNISGLPSAIKTMRITCVALDAGGATVGIGDKDVSIPVGGDSGNRSVRIAFNAQAGKQARQATRYRCTLYEPNAVFIAQSADPANRSILVVEGAIRR